MIKIDARGMSCPQPVLMTKKAIKENSDQVEVLVDNETARGNVSRFLSTSGYRVSFNNDGDETIIIGDK